MSVPSPQLYKNVFVYKKSIFSNLGWLNSYLLILLLICSAQAQCFNSNKNYKNTSCTICIFNNNLLSCFFHSTDDDECFGNCCFFTYNTTFKQCNTNSKSNSSSNDSHKTIIIIVEVIMFSLVSIVIIICIRICCKRKSDVIRNQSSVSTIDLQQMDLNQMGPIFINQKQNCSICLEQNCSIRTRCGHIFHSHCLKVWIQKKESCPNCVTSDYNPIIIHCNKCFKSIKLALLTAQQNQQSLREWSSNQNLICVICSSSSLPSSILQINIPSYGEMVQQVRTYQSNITDLNNDR